MTPTAPHRSATRNACRSSTGGQEHPPLFKNPSGLSVRIRASRKVFLCRGSSRYPGSWDTSSTNRRKGLEPLLRALAHLPSSRYHLSVVGKDREQRYFERLARNLPVTFCGPQSNIRPFYSQADTLVIPSYYDPFANVTVEALAMGLFVVTSRMNGGHEILSPAQGTLIDDLFELDSVLAALHRALQHPKTAASAAAIRASVQHRDFPLILDQLMEACGV